MTSMVTLPEAIAEDVLKLARLDRKTDREVKAMYPSATNVAQEPENPLWLTLSHISNERVRSLLNHVATTLLQPHTDPITDMDRIVWLRLRHMSASEGGQQILNYLIQQGCVTNLEAYKNLKMSRGAVRNHLDTLEDLGLLKTYTTIQNKPELPAEYRNAKVRGWIGLPPEYSQRAVYRYLAFFKKESPAKLQAETVEKWASRVEELLPVALEGRLSPILVAIREIGVPPALVAEVKDRVIGMRVRKVPGPVGVEEASP